MAIKIQECTAKEIVDSRGTPTIEVTVAGSGFSARASVPSGKSRGSHEAYEMRDNDGHMKGAIESVKNIIHPELKGKTFSSSLDVDELLIALDGTKEKTRLGANAMLGVSVAVSRLFADQYDIPLWRFVSAQNDSEPSMPRLYMNMINGGEHAQFQLPFQEYIVVLGKEGSSFKERFEHSQHIFNRLGKDVYAQFREINYGDEGGYTFFSNDNEKPFELLTEIIEPYGDSAFLAIDAAANALSRPEGYLINGQTYNTQQLIELYTSLVRGFPLQSIEDPFREDDAESFATLTAAFAGEILVVGDDLTVTNASRIQDLATQGAANAVIIKPNQTGTLRETFDAVRQARDNGWQIIVSHRSGETSDDFIADIAYGLGAYGLKAGASTQKERVAKYSRLADIEDSL